MQAKKDEMKRELENEIRVQQAQGLLASIDEKCFAKCITKPGTSMSRTEETCLSRCLDRYMEAFDIVSRVYLARIQRERIDRST
ncbi:hypothetical protein GLOTRDRAFT_43890 [Gloeophyllum trabeum ATCC 11539]|uniref:Mitochondrial import inner membrane translocase subunit n=1 Tax=Gloeophyllum trabeum (strain ATCC 11539 / FP-39264 / Madison 617) TaxID=670483 RepID=S7Q438_GLOTA|nr:uncharacterized protein GLOTRDRAFT_43890 [Gloeophyllum trabeum ATCC 11539]EPQ54287.1 hypothetical protein GLOTRDRAFT_43890 [Gloeophyllum trabeum ATCC 11539]